MAYIKLPQPQNILLAALIFIGASSSTELKVLSAESNNLTINNQQSTIKTPSPLSSIFLAQTPPPLPDNGAPDQREGAASRGPCPKVDRRLTTLMPLVRNTVSGSQDSPASTTTSTLVLSKSATSHPSFWFYLPYTLTPARSAEFMLQDQTGKEIYQSTLTESGDKPGVVGFDLPSTAPSLEVGKRYHWFFTVSCGQEASVHVEGWVERVALNSSLQRQLEQARPQEKFALYRQAGFWQEAITTLAQLRRQKPDDAALKIEWTNLLKSVDLEAIASEPITAMLTTTSDNTSSSSFVPTP
jgi:hypothetical protein